jgi:hypothetical protein
LLDYFDAMERRVAAGDHRIAITLARLYFKCRMQVDNPPKQSNPDHPFHLTASLCKTLPERPSDYEQSVVAEAALRGVQEAVLNEMGYVPAHVVAAPQSERAQDWALAATDRLSALADQGNAEAAFRVAREYMLDQYGIQDLDRAALYYRMSIDHTVATDMRNTLSRQHLARICATGRLRAESNRHCL